MRLHVQTIAVTAVGLFSLAPFSRAQTITPEITEAAIDALYGWYNQTDGRFSTDAPWWLTGFGLQGVLDYMQKTGSSKYLSKAEYTIEQQKGSVPWWPQGNGSFRADSTDDTGWWALVNVRLFDITGDQQYLDMAKLDEEYMFSYWTEDECGGGMIQDIRNMQYKNAISNELYLKLAASLANRVAGESKYVDRAKLAWEWLKGSGMINAEGLFNDGLSQNDDNTCSNNGQPTWTYNQGVVLGGLAELYRATGDEAYLIPAKQIAEAVFTRLSPNGILTEPCIDVCNQDQVSFKGGLMRNLDELATATGNQTYRSYLTTNAQSAYNNDRNATDFYGVSWAGPYEDASVGSQAAAVSVLVAAL